MPFLGELSALTTAILWSGTSIVFSSATRRVGAMQVNITRLFLALIFLAVSIAVIGAPVNVSAEQLVLLAVSGVIGLTFGDTFLFLAFKECGARISMLVMASAPAMSAVLAWMFLGEALSFWGVTGMGITLAGIVGVVVERREAGEQPHGRVTRRGVFYAFLGALGQAVGLIFAKLAFNLGDVHGFVASFTRIGAAVVSLLPIIVFTPWYPNPFRVFRRDPRALTLTAVGAVIGPYLGITFSLISIQHTDVAIAATIMATPPILMLPMVRLVYKEQLSWRAVAGAFIAVAGVAVLFLR
ncbi:MAG: DMT family transporter [Ignavibacteriae bacterium]|nr:DMT family transporter [Ignavibacteriota bacterium]